MHRRLLLLAVLLMNGSIHATFVSFEAKSGTLGGDWKVNNSSNPVFILITGAGAGGNPGTAARVASGRDC